MSLWKQIQHNKTEDERPKASLWNTVNYHNKYTESNLANADYRGGLWKSMNYHTYMPKQDEMVFPDSLWKSTMYGKGREKLGSNNVGLKSKSPSINSQQKLPYDEYGNIDYKVANKDLEGLLHDKEGELGYIPDYKNKPKRSAIDRVFDLLNIGQFAVMGGLYNVTDKNPETTFLGGVKEGIKSGNPLGDDYQEYEKSFADVLDNIGWKKENPDGSLFKPSTWNANDAWHGLASLAGNIFLDPLNYLSLGTKQLIEGTGTKVGKEIIEGTTEGTAKKVLKEVGEEATETNVKEIIRQLDKLKGIKKGGRGISYGLQNVPFLNRLGGGKYNKTLVDADTIRKFSDDVGIGSLTNKALTSIGESKLGKLFNTNVDLKQLAKLDDFEAGKILKFMDQGYGRSAEQIMKNLDSIEWANKNLRNLSSKDQELITKLLENPDLLDKGVYKVNFADTDLGKELRSEIDKFVETEAQNLSSVDEIASELDSIFKINKETSNQKVGNIINKFDKITGKPSKKEDIYNDIVDLLKEEKEKISSEVNWRNFDEFYEMSNFDEVRKIAKNTRIFDQDDKVRLLNDAMFGGKEVISPMSQKYIVNDLYDMLIDDTPFDKIVDTINSNYKSSLNTHGVEVHDYLRNKFGYNNFYTDIEGKIDKFRNRIDTAIKPELEKEFGYSVINPRDKARFDEIYNAYKNAGSQRAKDMIISEYGEEFSKLYDSLSTFQNKHTELFTKHPDYKNFMQYSDMRNKRNVLRDELYNLSKDDLKEFLTKEANKDIDSLLDTLLSKSDDARKDWIQAASHHTREYVGHNKYKTYIQHGERLPKSMDDLKDWLSRRYFDGQPYEILKHNDPIDKARKEFIDNTAKELRPSKEFAPTEEQIENFLLKKADPLFNINQDKPLKITSDIAKDSGRLLNKVSVKDIDGTFTINNVEDINNIDFTDGSKHFNNFVNSLTDTKETPDMILEGYKKMAGDAYNSIQDYMADIYNGNYKGNLQDKFKLYYDAINSQEVFETLGRVKYGDEVVDSVTTKIRSIVIDDMDVDEQIVKTTRELSKLFDDMFVKELNLGVMPPDKYIGGYAPHVLTPEAKKFVSDPKNKGMVTDMFGFGKEFNIHSLERKHKGTIEKINSYMKDTYGIDKFFETEISDIYLARAMKHNNVVYDRKFTNELFDKFGKKIEHISELGKDNKAVLSYHDLKNFTYRLNEKDKVKFFKELGIDEKLLDTYITPLIELTPENVEAISKYSKGLPMYSVNNIMVEHANKIAKIQSLRDTNTLLKLHDKFLHLYKMNVTAVIPGFHARNKYSNMFQNYLDIGSEAIHPKNQMQATQILTGKDGFIKTRFGKKITFEEIRQHMSAYGLTDSGYFTGELKDGVLSGGNLDLGDISVNPFNDKNFIPYKLGRSFGGFIENQDKTVNFVANLKLGKGFAESAEHVNKFLFDYSDLTDFEMNVVKRIVPFYTWLRKNTPLQLEMMLEKPEIYRNLSKMLNAFEDSVGSDDRIDREYLNDFAQDWIQLPGKVKNPEGREEPLLWNPNLPYDDVDRFYNPLTPVDSTKKLITQMNPLIKMPIELATNRNIYFDSDIEKYPGHTVPQPGYLDPIGHYKGEPEQMSPKVKYVLDQIASLKALGKFVEKKGFDKAVHGVNTLGGVKVMSYDYDKYKYYMLRDRLKELEEIEKKNKYR